MVNLITNGDFSGSVNNATDGDPSGWLTTETVAGQVRVQSGELRFDTGNTNAGGFVTQTINAVTIGHQITVGFNFSIFTAGIPLAATSSVRFEVYAGPTATGTPVVSIDGNASSPSPSATFVATATTYTIKIIDTSTGSILNLLGTVDPVVDNVVFDAAPVCFVAGTKILTKAGQKLVEELQIGDQVKTLDHGFQDIRWVGKRTFSGSGAFAPICFKAAYLDIAEDLYVSQEHKILLSNWRAELLFGVREVLVAAKHLVDGENVFIEDRESVDYYHFMFDAHEVVFANGAPSESLYPCVGALERLCPAARKEILTLFPELQFGTDIYGTTARMVLAPDEFALIAA